jgi:Protein of unknown function (DUF3237)
VQLEPLFEIDVRVRAPLSLGATQSGEVRLIAFAGGEFRGEGLSGQVLDGGSDWQVLRPDGVLEIRAHYLLETDLGERLEVVSEGVRDASPEVIERIGRGEAVPASDYYFRTFVRLSSAAPRLSHLNRRLALAVGERERDRVHLVVYRVP